MRTSDAINELATALAKAQTEIKNAVLNKINPHFKSKYADLAAVRDAVTLPLAGCGISIVQMTGETDGKLIVYTRLLHTSGQWIESAYPIISDTNKPQAMGSALTYARRYSIASLCNIASEEDDDGNEAQEHGTKAPETHNVAGTNGARKAPARNDYDMLVQELRKATTIEALKEWATLRKGDIDKLPADWVDNLHDDYADHKASLAAKLLGAG